MDSDYKAFVTFAVVCAGLIIVFSAWYIRVLRRQLRQQNQTLNKQTQTNPQTSLYTRARIEAIIADELRRYQRYQRPFSVILLTVAQQKLPERAGKQAGNEVLLSLASLLTVNIRGTDNIGHLNNETFIIVCPETALAQAQILAENLQTAVASCKDTQNRGCSSSVGVTEVTSDDNKHTLLLRAERALSQAMAAANGQEDTSSATAL
jgi:diguanylate cyclase (GGDEF)-like protein